jgi:hypothetical protein
MNKLLQNQIFGEMWMRTPSGKILPYNIALSSLNLKYNSINSNFNFELTNNLINRFDFFYDVIFIETNSGYIFEKLKKNGDVIFPENNDNRLTLKSDIDVNPDYWLDEPNKKIYIVENKLIYWDSDEVKLNIIVKQFNITENLYSTKLSYVLHLKYCNFNITKKPIIEPCKISYNIDTKCFNVSFILRGNNNEFGLISNTLKKNQNLEIDNINCLLPYASLQEITTDILINNSLEIDFYN